MAKAPKIIPQPHWDKLSPMDKIKWYVDAAATPRYPLFESLLRDAGMPEKGTYTPEELGKVFGCSGRTLLDWRAKGLEPRNLPSGARYFAEDGGPLTKGQLGSLVSNLTLRYTGRRVNPHLFRDIFVHYGLNHHQDELPAISKHLWHKSPEITLIIYGWMFDEAEALCQGEGWFEETEEGGPPQQPPKMKPSNGKTADIGPNWHNPKKKKAA